MIEPKITVVIPTRERCDVLEKSLRTVTEQNYDNLDILVSDNASTDDTEAVVRGANDARIKYVNTGKRLSMSHNWEFALSHVDDAGWVTIIGDDDGILPGSLNKIAEIIQSTDIQAIRTRTCGYRWPSPANTHPVVLEVPLASGSELRQARQWLDKVLVGDADYPQLPMLYNGGFVSMSVLQEIKSRSGSFYRSCNPDIYSAVAISSIVDRYVFVHDPLAISGASSHSTGISYFAEKASSEISPAHVFDSEKNIPLHEDLPLSKSGRLTRSIHLLVYESYLQSSCLRPAEDGNRHAEQLEVILAAAGTHSSEIYDWGAEFAGLHGLDYAAIRSKARRRKVIRKLSSTAKAPSLAMANYFVVSPKEPITDVFQASVAAAAIRADIPGPIRRLSGLVKYAARITGNWVGIENRRR